MVDYVPSALIFGNVTDIHYNDIFLISSFGVEILSFYALSIDSADVHLPPQSMKLESAIRRMWNTSARLSMAQ